MLLPNNLFGRAIPVRHLNLSLDLSLNLSLDLSLDLGLDLDLYLGSALPI